MDTTADRAERGRAIVKNYFGHEGTSNGLAAILTDLIAYADTLGSAAFANNLNAALVRNGKRGMVEQPEPPKPYSAAGLVDRPMGCD